MRNIRSILIDTDALVHLADPDKIYHKNVKDIIEFAVKNDVDIFLSAIVLSEFNIKQDISLIPKDFLDLFHPLPFTLEHAKKTGMIIDLKHLKDGTDKNRAKDDFKIMAQVSVERIGGIVTNNIKDVSKIFQFVIDEFKLDSKVITINKSLDSHLSESDSSQTNLFEQSDE